MVAAFHGKSHRSKWMMTGGTPMDWKPPYVLSGGDFPQQFKLKQGGAPPLVTWFMDHGNYYRYIYHIAQIKWTKWKVAKIGDGDIT